jgi:hypothetical protein
MSMSSRCYKWISFFLLTIVLLSGVAFWIVIKSQIELVLELGAVRGEAELIESLWVASNLSEPQAAAEALLRLKEYHQSRPLKPGSNAEAILELHKRAVRRGIIQFLRNKTGQDLGDDPDRWIEKYGTLTAEPDGGANGSQPIRLETNQTSAPAGSSR